MTDGDTRADSPTSRPPPPRPPPAAPADAAPASPLRWWKEMLIAGGFYLVYTLVRNQFGSGGAGDRDIALNHAKAIIHIERSVGLWFEPRLQQWYLDLPYDGFIRVLEHLLRVAPLHRDHRRAGPGVPPDPVPLPVLPDDARRRDRPRDHRLRHVLPHAAPPPRRVGQRVRRLLPEGRVPRVRLRRHARRARRPVAVRQRRHVQGVQPVRGHAEPPLRLVVVVRDHVHRLLPAASDGDGGPSPIRPPPSSASSSPRTTSGSTRSAAWRSSSAAGRSPSCSTASSGGGGAGARPTTPADSSTTAARWRTTPFRGATAWRERHDPLSRSASEAPPERPHVDAVDGGDLAVVLLHVGVDRREVRQRVGAVPPQVGRRRVEHQRRRVVPEVVEQQGLGARAWRPRGSPDRRRGRRRAR